MGKLQRWIVRAVRGFWLIPVLCVLGSVALAEGLVAFDEHVVQGSGLTARFDPIFQIGVDGSRGLLSAIGGSVFGAAATAFSITISVIATTSTNYGPRLVGNFMSDRRNQWTLGVLVSTFVYTTLVLRHLRTLQDGSVFVPHVAVYGAIVLAIADVFLLISFIHNIASSTQVESLVATVSSSLRSTVKGRQREVSGELPASDPPHGGELVGAWSDGYVIALDEQALRQGALQKEARIAMEVRVGDHVVEGSPIARVWQGDGRGDPRETVWTAVDLADRRDTADDMRVAIEHLVELAVRAISPGTNDPYTAVTAIDELSGPLGVMMRGRAPAQVLGDDNGVPRVWLRPTPIEELIALPFDQVLPYAGGQGLVLEALVGLARHLEQQNTHPELEGVAWAHVERVRALAREDGKVDETRVEARIARAEELLALGTAHRDAD